MQQVAFHGAGCHSGCLLFPCLTKIGVQLSDEDRFAAVSSCLRRFQSGKQTYEQNICFSVTPATIKTPLHY